jgi:hypothetical protein
VSVPLPPDRVLLSHSENSDDDDNDVVFIQGIRWRILEKGSCIEPLYRFQEDITPHSCIKRSQRTPTSGAWVETLPFLWCALNKGFLLRLDIRRLTWYVDVKYDSRL